MKRDTGFVVIVVLIVLTVALLAASVENEGCLPWQERVGSGDFSRCDGSWFPFGSALLPAAPSGGLSVVSWSVEMVDGG